MTIQTTPVRRTQGFTLIEMLVVAALIAIFAGLAVFNIVEQLQREKEKAALAEARSIATAMSFAYDDLGFFPKLCFLKFGVDELKKTIADDGLLNNEIEYHGYPNGNMLNMIGKNWGEKYMGGSMPEKYVRMRFGANKEMDWPADPFKQPYVAYFVKIEPPAGSTDPNAVPEPSFLSKFGEKPNYFAGIVSYGRNKVPGLTWDVASPMSHQYANFRLYTPTPNDRVFVQTEYNNLVAGHLMLLTDKAADIPGAGPTDYSIREAGSDDKFFEF